MKGKWALTRQRGRGTILQVPEKARAKSGWCDCVRERAQVQHIGVYCEYEELQVNDTCILSSQFLVLQSQRHHSF